MMMVSLRPFNEVSRYPSKRPLVYRKSQTSLSVRAQTLAVPSRTQVFFPRNMTPSQKSMLSPSALAEKAVHRGDVVVCGGTWKIFIVTALNAKGIKREQEWNISRKELMELVEAGILDEDDIEEATAVLLNPAMENVKKRFISLGGVILEGCSLSCISIYDDAACVFTDI